MTDDIKVSVIIPTKNRKKILRKYLQALNNQSYDHNKFEIIIIDDGSSEDNKTMIEKINLKPEVNYIYQENTGPAQARNRGIKLAKGEYVVFIDDDIIVNRNFLKNHMKNHKSNDNVIVHGPVIYTNDLENPRNTEKKMRDFSNAYFATGNASIKKDHLKKVGLFDSRFNEYGWEDLELGTRLKKLNLKPVQEKEARGYHLKHEFSPQDIPNIKNRERQRGRMAVLYHEINSSFAVKASTLYWKPFMVILEILTIGKWPQKKAVNKLITYLHEKNIYSLRNFFLYFVKLDSYLLGLKEGYKNN